MDAAGVNGCSNGVLDVYGPISSNSPSKHSPLLSMCAVSSPRSPGLITMISMRFESRIDSTFGSPRNHFWIHPQQNDDIDMVGKSKNTSYDSPVPFSILFL